MEHSQKMILTPMETESPPTLPPSTASNIVYNSEQQTQPKIVKSRKTKSHPLLEKITNQLLITLKLAKIDGYDDKLRIRNNSNDFIDSSNVVNLLQNATSNAKVLIGEEPFIDRLFEAGVGPELLSNENYKYKLIKLYEAKSVSSQQNITNSEKLYSTTSPLQTNISNTVPVIQSNKRQLEEIDELGEESNKKQKTDWITPPEDIPLPEENDTI